MRLLIPTNERARLQVLHEHRILDTPPEARFDRIVANASSEFGVPITAFTLIDESRQWFKARIGLEIEETKRSLSFCSHAVAINAPLVIEDTLKDIEFADCGLVVSPPFIRFYAGVPVRAENKAPIGALCIIDTSPRSFPWSDFLHLNKLARHVETELRHRKALLTVH